MCGIVGYVGDRDLVSVLLVGLERLSYRGYDSSGIATICDGELSFWKSAGKIHELERILQGLSVQGNIGIGHTRWATHGQPNNVNAHPHVSTDNRVAVVHNGIIENYIELRRELQASGFIFQSETDTEVIVHLIRSFLKKGVTLQKAVSLAIQRLVGAYGLSVISEVEPEKIVVARKGSPLIIGVGKGENFVSSDINAIIHHTKDIMYLDDGELAIVTKDGVSVSDAQGAPVEKVTQHIKWDPVAAEKNGYDHFMLKEIYEQPEVVKRIISKYILSDHVIHFPKLAIPNQDFLNISRFIIQACGTSWHAGLYAKYLLEKYANIVTEVDISSEFRYRQKVSSGEEIVVALSQSGETADTLACIREAKSKFFKILSFVNSKSSSMDIESDAVIYSYAGQEIGVASTKNFIAQLVTIYLFTMYVAKLKWSITEEEYKEKISDLSSLPQHIESILDKASEIKKLAQKYSRSPNFIFIGRGMDFPIALEGALKLKEISYIHSTGYPAGELKHGPIALIDERIPVVCIAPKTSATYEKMVSNIEEVRARKGRTIVIATEGDEGIKDHAEDVIYIPNVSAELTPVLASIPLQLLSYYIALELACDVDQPRNLAKSVTVE
jgi:glucosamine--fructose-6-phosphate aminotransferase (isomerizing)